MTADQLIRRIETAADAHAIRLYNWGASTYDQTDAAQSLRYELAHIALDAIRLRGQERELFFNKAMHKFGEDK